MSAPNKKALAAVVVIAGLGAAVPVALRFVPGGVFGGGESAGDRALDESFMSGPRPSRYPVHPPRGQRSKLRDPRGVQIQPEPIICSGAGGNVTRGNVRLTINAGRAAVIRDGCLLRLVNVDLRANDGIVLEGGRLEMTNGSIEARGVAIRASGDSTVELSNVDVQGASGIEASGTARVLATGGSLRATGAVIVARDQAQVALEDAELDGPIARDEGAQVTVDGAEAPSEG